MKVKMMGLLIPAFLLMSLALATPASAFSAWTLDVPDIAYVDEDFTITWSTGNKLAGNLFEIPISVVGGVMVDGTRLKIGSMPKKNSESFEHSVSDAGLYRYEIKWSGSVKNTDYIMVVVDVDSYEEQIAALDAEIASLGATIAGYESDIAELQADLADCVDEIDDLERDIRRLNRRIDFLKLQRTILVKLLEWSWDRIVTLYGEKAALEDLLEESQDNTAALETQIDDLNDEIAQLENDIADLEAQIADLEAELAALEEVKAELEEELAELKIKKAILESQLASAQAEIDELNRQEAIATETISSLRAQIRELQAEVDLLNRQPKLGGGTTVTTSASDEQAQGVLFAGAVGALVIAGMLFLKSILPKKK